MLRWHTQARLVLPLLEERDEGFRNDPIQVRLDFFS